MEIGTMNLTTPTAAARTAPAQEQARTPGAESTPVDGFSKSEQSEKKSINWKNVGKLALGAVVGGSLGVAAGLLTGPLAAVAGGISGLMGGTALGVLGGAYLGDKFGHGESPKVAGIAIWTTLGAGAAGLAAGIYVGAAISNPFAAAALGTVGAFGGFGKSLLGLATEK